MPAGRYLFIPFFRTKSQMRQTKNGQAKNCIKTKIIGKKRQDKYDCYKLRLRATNNYKIMKRLPKFVNLTPFGSKLILLF